MIPSRRLPAAARRAFAAADRCGARARGWATLVTHRQHLRGVQTRWQEIRAEVLLLRMQFSRCASHFCSLFARPRPRPAHCCLPRGAAPFSQLLSPICDHDLSHVSPRVPLSTMPPPTARGCLENFFFCLENRPHPPPRPGPLSFGRGVWARYSGDLRGIFVTAAPWYFGWTLKARPLRLLQLLRSDTFTKAPGGGAEGVCRR